MNKKDYKDLIKMRSERYTTCNNLLYCSNGAFTKYSTVSGSITLFLYKDKVAYLKIRNYVFWGAPNRTVSDSDIALISNVMLYTCSPSFSYRVKEINPEKLKEDSQNFIDNLFASLLNKVKPKDIGDFIKNRINLISAYAVFDGKYNYFNAYDIFKEKFPEEYKKYSDFLESENLRQRAIREKKLKKDLKEAKKIENIHIREFYKNPLDTKKLWNVSCGYNPVANVDGTIVSLLHNRHAVEIIYTALKVMNLNSIDECSISEYNACRFSNMGRLAIKGRMAVVSKRNKPDEKYRLCDFGM